MRSLSAFLICAAALLVSAGCRGTTPQRGGLPEHGMAAVIVGSRFYAPSGETLSGGMAINLGGEGGRRAEVYRMPIKPHQTLLYQVEPGIYRLNATRSIFGFDQTMLKVRIGPRTFRIPFPRDVLRKPVIEIKPKKIVPIGVFEVRQQQALPGQTPSIRILLDDSIAARRQIVQDIIHEMMDPAAPVENRESAVAWVRSLEGTLMDLLSETERTTLFKSGQ